MDLETAFIVRSGNTNFKSKISADTPVMAIIWFFSVAIISTAQPLLQLMVSLGPGELSDLDTSTPYWRTPPGLSLLWKKKEMSYDTFTFIFKKLPAVPSGIWWSHCHLFLDDLHVSLPKSKILFLVPLYNFGNLTTLDHESVTTLVLSINFS